MFTQQYHPQSHTHLYLDVCNDECLFFNFQKCLRQRTLRNLHKPAPVRCAQRAHCETLDHFTTDDSQMTSSEKTTVWRSAVPSSHSNTVNSPPFYSKLENRTYHTCRVDEIASLLLFYSNCSIYLNYKSLSLN